ncbi:MAG: MSMEG_4193 family putative phosphomutase [Actinobacteria bacterium]|jgi:2,3-bisphosphoglycerate-dependent phosphoglycerate mutase|nr:MSMEG_4193 family putative phosphomutase [Actinomycetota bacterium]
MPVCLLVRHGHSTANERGILAGWMPEVALTERGRAQAALVAERIADLTVARLVSSPLQRCRETAALIRTPDGPDVEVDDRLGECGYGEWTGRPLGELAEDPLWRRVQDDPATAAFADSTAYAGESLATMTARVVGAVRALDAEVAERAGPDALWIALSHGDPIKAVLASAAGGGVAQLQRWHVDPGSVSVVRFAGERSMVLASNVRDGGLVDLVRATAAPPDRVGEGAVGGGAG